MVPVNSNLGNQNYGAFRNWDDKLVAGRGQAVPVFFNTSPFLRNDCQEGREWWALP